MNESNTDNKVSDHHWKQLVKAVIRLESCLGKPTVISKIHAVS